MKRMTVAALAATTLLGSAEPALAKNEFETAFKLELGRIAAHETVRVGRRILTPAWSRGPGRNPGHWRKHSPRRFRYRRTPVIRQYHYYFFEGRSGRFFAGRPHERPYRRRPQRTERHFRHFQHFRHCHRY